ncbi:ATP synthase regulation protein NCA2-domain-containing protein [Pelagophyceae sp. CCMP2097]|nr:ATP synthase regulation protein NCA2-domain-containing protein [Pelagophyceae sp. CCMP2097]
MLQAQLLQPSAVDRALIRAEGIPISNLLRRARLNSNPWLEPVVEPQKDKLELLVGLLREATFRELDELAPVLDDLKYWREFGSRGSLAVVELGPAATWSCLKSYVVSFGVCLRSWVRCARGFPEARARSDSGFSSNMLRSPPTKFGDEDDQPRAKMWWRRSRVGTLEACRNEAEARASALAAMLRRRAAAVVPLNAHAGSARKLRPLLQEEEGLRWLFDSSPLGTPGSPPRLQKSDEAASASSTEVWMARATQLLEQHLDGALVEKRPNESCADCGGVPSLEKVVSLGDALLVALEERRLQRALALAPHRQAVRWALRAASAASHDFVMVHVVGPARAIVAHTFFLRRQRLADAQALADATRSLEVMLADWLRDTFPKMAPRDVLELARSHDMGTVTKEYEKSLVYSVANIVAGDLVRMVLIQVQCIKRELLVAMAALEELTESNDFNFRAMATVPAFLAAYVSYHAWEHVLDAGFGRPSRRALRRAMQALLRELERLLTRSAPAQGTLDDDSGLVLLCVHNLRKLLTRNRHRFSATTCYHLLEDLAELGGERGDVSVEQRLLIVQRVQRWHPFLRPTSELG